MGKRKTTIVVSSSDDDDDDDKTFSLRSKMTSNPKSKSRPSSVPRANSRRTATKKARLSDSRAVSCKESSGFDEVESELRFGSYSVLRFYLVVYLLRVPLFFGNEECLVELD